MIDLKNKKVLVTGGSRGIGAACVKLFHNANAKVSFTYNSNKDLAEKLVNEIAPGKINLYQLELSDLKNVEKKIKEINDENDGIDILVNNAGIWKFGTSDEMSLNEWKETIDINLNAVFIITKELIPGMKKNRYGKIINVTSTAGQRGERNYSHYAASKGALISYTKSLAAELGGYNINVNSVAPGWVYTDMTKGALSDDEYRQSIIDEIPINRIATAEDIAGPILFLSSELARHINGEIVNVNGGSILCG